MRDNDSLILAQEYFHSLILSIIQEEQAKDKASFKYVSFEWIGKPGWYFWPKEQQGVYYLKLEEATRNGEVLESLFQLYYYPHLDESVFDNFSLTEQMVRVSDIFSKKGVQFTTSCPLHSHEDDQQCQHHFHDLEKGKGIPTVEAREQLNTYLYRVGELTLSWKGTRLRSCIIEAPIYSQTWAIEDVVFPGEDENTILLKTQSIDRDLPSWDLVKFFTERFFLDLGLVWKVFEEQDFGEFAVKNVSICFGA